MDDYKVADISLADFGRKGNYLGRSRNARTYGSAPALCQGATTCRGKNHRLHSHDDSNGCTDRDAG